MPDMKPPQAPSSATPQPSQEASAHQTATPLQALQAILMMQQPASILVCSTQDIPGLSEYSNSRECQTSYVDLRNGQDGLNSLQRFDVVIVADMLEQLPKTIGQELLGRLHNLHSNKICVLYSPNKSLSAGSGANDQCTNWAAVDFFALGFKLAQSFTRKDDSNSAELQMYTYDIESYNHRRDWNNSRFWANPENFGKYWW